MNSADWHKKRSDYNSRFKRIPANSKNLFVLTSVHKMYENGVSKKSDQTARSVFEVSKEKILGEHCRFVQHFHEFGQISQKEGIPSHGPAFHDLKEPIAFETKPNHNYKGRL